MDGITIVIFIIAIIAMAVYRIWSFISSLNNKLKERLELINKNEELIISLSEYKRNLSEVNSLFTHYQDIVEDTIKNMRNDSVLLPSLARWADNLKEHEDEKIINYLKYKKRPAYKASEEVTLARSKAREYRKEVELARNRVELYESLSPLVN